ncbi:MAG: ATP-dependent DNA helicase RecG [Anaerolineaceae bacterium]|nr:ATP-dependent DNA helicase RecG [Anaerolineae bacterium]MDL1925375.1 ATP-dependent DNA helicase RecG [Anaerolineae bacterium AMX1]WKZ54087.1 MAG: ATP-dependent DNA helicase RecG [Anaerolineales bacterium]GJQ40338.1 MAG: ATP-dependent DNA helicase RecG [Anaerolineaceae bacterium]HMM98334.1 ATP-dependent DNA helicase RecG [Anaerolineales bacterium]
MLPSLEKLRKFFRLEHENGYNNTAIIGGLVKILDFWESEARAESVDEAVVQAVTQRLKGYEALTPQGRADSLKGLWKRLGETYPEATQKPKDQPRPQQRPRPPQEPRPQQPPAPKAEGEEMPKWLEPETKSVPPREQAERPRPPATRAPAPSQGRSESAPGGKTSATPAALGAQLTVLQGVGPRHAQTLGQLGMVTLGDMLYYFPRRYEDYSQLKPIKNLWVNEIVTVIGAVQSVGTRPVKGGKLQLTEAVITDGTGALRLTWFNQPWIANRMKVGDNIAASGKLTQALGRLVMTNPDFEPVEAEHLHTNRIVPIYPLTQRITQKWLRGLMNQVVTYWAPALVDHLPDSIRTSAGLSALGRAVAQAHFPDSQADLKRARERLAFDEIFFLQMGVLSQKRDWQAATARRFEISDEQLGARLSSLPFTLTSAQTRAVDEIRRDLASGRPMNRLLQGDVGSGKTVVAALAAAMVNQSGAQAAIMAPTSILAEQHYRNFTSLLDGTNVRLLVGDTPESEKAEIRAGLADGTIKVVVGTHALIEDPVAFQDLQLAVIDEQHRFGVEQRAALRNKGTTPHLLVMTATPIPRSLALTLYGDLDLSVMDEMPAGRQPIETYVLRPQELERAFSLICSQIKDGRQAFIIYPLVEESEKMDNLKAATEEHEKLQKEIFPELKLGLLHGRMKPDEKDRVMADFRDRKYDILVSTTVVEVGVDVPNATVMLVEGANHFGLAQLHQLRGRVGRGAAQSYCLLVPDHEDAVENERLQAMAETNDGFILADRDLQQRGPGEFLGTRQAGFASTLKMASITDLPLIEKARNQAQMLFEKDPNLEMPEHKLLAEALGRFWGKGTGDVS